MGFDTVSQMTQTCRAVKVFKCLVLKRDIQISGIPLSERILDERG